MAKRYVIKRGEDWTSIASKYRVSPTELVRMNKEILSPTAGTVIKVPDASGEMPPEGYPVIGQPVPPGIPPSPVEQPEPEPPKITPETTRQEIWAMLRQGLLQAGESERRMYGGNLRVGLEEWIKRRGGPSLKTHERNWAYQRWGRKGETVQDFWNRLYSQTYAPPPPQDQAQAQTQQTQQTQAPYVQTPTQRAAATAGFNMGPDFFRPPPPSIDTSYQPPVNPMQPVIERDRGMVGPSPRMQLKTAPPRPRRVPGVEQLPQFLPREALPRPTMLPDTWLQGIPRTVAATRAQLMAGIMPRTISVLDQILLRIYDGDMEKMGYRYDGRTWVLREPAKKVKEDEPVTRPREFTWNYGGGRSREAINQPSVPEPAASGGTGGGGYMPGYATARGVSPTGRIMNNLAMGLVVWRGI